MQRLHSSLGYVAPVEFERDYYRQINPRQHPLAGELAVALNRGRFTLRMDRARDRLEHQAIR